MSKFSDHQKIRPNFSKWPFKGHWKRKKLCANHWRRWEAQSRTNCTNKQKLLTSCWWPFVVRRFLQEVFSKKLPQLMVQVENGAFFHDYQRRHFCPFGVFFLELHCKTPGFDIGICCWFIPWNHGCLLKEPYNWVEFHLQYFNQARSIDWRPGKLTASSFGSPLKDADWKRGDSPVGMVAF